MLIEAAAYSSSWRQVAPGAKAMFALAGVVAAFLAHSPGVALGVAALMSLVTLTGARVAPGLYLRVLLPPLGFLLLSSLSLLISLNGDGQGGLNWRLAPEALPRIAELSARSLAALSALLFLVLSTPLSDLIQLLRTLKIPEVLLDLMVLCYRMIFVFSEALRDTLTAQQARLGYQSARHSLRSLGLLTANLALQVWLRASHLHQAAMARNGEGPLRFLPRNYPAAARDQSLALVASLVLLTLVGVA